MDDTTRNYIDERMNSMGFPNYDTRQARIKMNASDTQKRINAHNEFWFLFDITQIDDAFTIDAENKRLVSTEDFDIDGVPYVMYELTGRIIINKTGNTATQVFMFYRVIPN